MLDLTRSKLRLIKILKICVGLMDRTTTAEKNEDNVFIYSKKIFLFINEIKELIKTILSKEVGLKVFSDRFYDYKQQCSYPIKVVIYNNKNMLGYFEAGFYELGFHEKLMFVTKNQLGNIIRHELAHFLAHIKFGSNILPHAGEFQRLCAELKWGEDISRAKIVLERNDLDASTQENGVLRKIEKLMSLSTSSNPHEAEEALIKAQQLLLKHNVDSKYIGIDDEEKVVLKRILKQKKENAKMRAIANILGTFFVSTVYTRDKEHIYLEILGKSMNVEIAEYVAGVLEYELENLWNKARYLGLKGMVAKNSFFLGIATGYCNKINGLKRTYSQEISKDIMVLEKQLIDVRDMVYTRLRSGSSHGAFCGASAALGELMGKQLKIDPAINHTSSQTMLLT